MRIMAGRALHSAGEKRNVSVAVHRAQVSRGLNAYGCRGGGVRIREVHRMLFAQVPGGHVVAHELVALWQRLEVRSELHFIPGVDRNRSVMAAQAQIADRHLPAEFGGSGTHAVTGVDAIGAHIRKRVVPQQVAGSRGRAAEFVRNVTEVAECEAGAARREFAFRLEIMGGAEDSRFWSPRCIRRERGHAYDESYQTGLSKYPHKALLNKNC